VALRNSISRSIVETSVVQIGKKSSTVSKKVAAARLFTALAFVCSQLQTDNLSGKFGCHRRTIVRIFGYYCDFPETAIAMAVCIITNSLEYSMKIELF
jgi:hypothetical protein